MSKQLGSQTSFIAGISFSEKEGPQNSVAFTRAVDHRSDPKGLTLNPKAINDSGTVVTDLPMWGARACSRTFAYGNTGNIYQKEGSAWTLAHVAPDSQGNGLAYFAADSALYYTQNKSFGRLLDACTGASFYDDFLGSEGGEPTNTKSLDLERASSQYASRADTASTSITGDLSIESYLKLESLPSTDQVYTLLSKWDENTNLRSYKFDITTTSNVFGDGSDGALTISSNTTQDPIDANCAGTVGTKILTISNAHASFAPAAGDIVFIHQTRGTNAGQTQRAKVLSWSSPTLTITEDLTFTVSHSASTTDANKAQIILMPQYTNVTVNTGITWTIKAWNGLKGGIGGAFLCNGTFTYAGSVVGRGKQVEAFQQIYGAGFRGGAGSASSSTQTGGQGESPTGFGGAATATQTTAGTRSSTKNGAGGGGGVGRAGGGGAGHAVAGSPGSSGQAGDATGSADLTSLQLGAGGGGGGTQGTSVSNAGVDGGGGGGIFVCWAASIVQSGSGLFNFNGGDVYPPGTGGGDDEVPSGAGVGGSVLLFCNTGVFNTNTISAVGGNSFVRRGTPNIYGGDAADGRIAVYYATSYTGTITSPNATFIQDSSLNTADGYVLRLLLSSNGTNSEIYSVEITNSLDITSWNRWAVTWTATTSTARFYRNGALIGTQVGSFTSISNNASRFAVGADFNSSAQNFYDGLMDDVRLWNDVRTQSELITNNDQKLFGTEANLVAYYEFENDVTDSQTSGLNDLTAVNSPVFSSDIPFSGLTTRNDQDQGLTSGSFVQSYTLGTSIDEGATHRQTFVPAKDPQKSILIDIDTVGTGDWTLTVHDSLNRVVATKTIANNQLSTGFFEFVFDDVWRPIIGATYHFHLTSTVADGAVDTTGSGDLETAYFTTHYQFLVNDSYHPIKEFLDFMVIGNERYLAKYEAGNIYNPHRLTLPSGYRIRCLAYWRGMIVAGCWKGTSITDYDDGLLVFWNGTDEGITESIHVPEGGVNAMFGTKDVLYLVAGYTGEILVYSGGGSAVKFNKIPKMEAGEYVEIAPGSMDMWRSNIHMGVNLNTDSETIHKGVYSIGSSNVAYPHSLGFDYPTSLGDQVSSMVKTSMVFPSGQNLYVGWQNGNAFGIDSINPNNDVYPDGTVELLIADMGEISKEKYPLLIRADFEPLRSGESLRVKYKADREADWKTVVVNGSEIFEDTEGAKFAKMRVPERMKELQVACDLRTTVATSPKLIGITVVSEMEESSAQNQ